MLIAAGHWPALREQVIDLLSKLFAENVIGLLGKDLTKQPTGLSALCKQDVDPCGRPQLLRTWRSALEVFWMSPLLTKR